MASSDAEVEANLADDLAFVGQPATFWDIPVGERRQEYGEGSSSDDDEAGKRFALRLPSGGARGTSLGQQLAQQQQQAQQERQVQLGAGAAVNRDAGAARPRAAPRPAAAARRRRLVVESEDEEDEAGNSPAPAIKQHAQRPLDAQLADLALAAAPPRQRDHTRAHGLAGQLTQQSRSLHRGGDGDGSDNEEAGTPRAAAGPATAAGGAALTPSQQAILTGQWRVQALPVPLPTGKLVEQYCLGLPTGSRDPGRIELGDDTSISLPRRVLIELLQARGYGSFVRGQLGVSPALEAWLEPIQDKVCLVPRAEMHMNARTGNLLILDLLTRSGLSGQQLDTGKQGPKELFSVLLKPDINSGIYDANSATEYVGGMAGVYAAVFHGLADGDEPLALVARHGTKQRSKSMAVVRLLALRNPAVREGLGGMLSLVHGSSTGPGALAVAAVVKEVVTTVAGEDAWQKIAPQPGAVVEIVVASFDLHGFTPSGAPAMATRDLVLRLTVPTEAAFAQLTAKGKRRGAAAAADGEAATLVWRAPQVVPADKAAKAARALPAAITSDPVPEGSDPVKKAVFANPTG